MLLQFVGFLTIGILLFAFHRPFEQPGFAAGPPAFPFLRPDAVFPHFITHHLPPGLAGLVVAAIFAAAMSSSLNSVAATALNDLYRPLKARRVRELPLASPHQDSDSDSDRQALSLSKTFTIIAGAAQILVGLAVRHSPASALDNVLAVASLLNGPVLGVFLLGAFTKKAGPRAALAGMIGGIAVILSVRGFTSVGWPWYAAIGSLTTLFVGALFGLTTPSPSEVTA